MRKTLPILICSVLLAACSSHSNTDSASPAPAASAPSAAASAPAATPEAASTASTAPMAAQTSSSASPTGTDTAPASQPAATSESEDDSAIPAAAVAQAKADFKDTGKWVEGTNYFRISPVQPRVTHTNKVEVVEVFSWGCPACNQAHTLVDSMHKSLPDYATMAYLPAAFRPDENWVVYQRAFYAAQALGVARKSYDAVFDATWKSGELATYNLGTGRPKSKEGWPGIEAFATFFAQNAGVKKSEFLAVAKSFSINTKMKRADALIKSYGVGGTPTFVVDGKYRFDFHSAGGGSQAIELAKWLAAKEASGN